MKKKYNISDKKTKPLAYLRKYSTGQEQEQREVTIGDIVKLANAQALQIADEQRNMEKKDKEYYARATRWIVGLLIQIKNVVRMSLETEAVVDKILNSFGIVKKVVRYTLPQTIEISLKETDPDVLFVSDGQHRFLNYIIDFINGDFVIDSTIVLDDAWAQAQLNQILLCAPNDGFEVKTIAWCNMSDDWKKAINDIVVNMNVINAKTEEERAHRYSEVNDVKAQTSNDGVKAKYGILTMFKRIMKMSRAFKGSERGEDLVFDLAGEVVQYSGKDADLLRAVMVKEASRIPFIAQNALISYIGDDEAEDFGWKYGDSQTKQVYKFFELTKNWSEKQCDQLLKAFLDDLLLVANNVYLRGSVDAVSKWAQARTFTTGVIFGYHTLESKDYLDAAYDVAKDLILYHEFSINDGDALKTLTFADVNNTHYNRKRVEKVHDVVAAWMRSGGENS